MSKENEPSEVPSKVNALDQTGLSETERTTNNFKENASSKTKIVIIISAIVLVLIASLLVIYLVLRNRKPKPKPTTVPTLPILEPTILFSSTYPNIHTIIDTTKPKPEPQSTIIFKEDKSTIPLKEPATTLLTKEPIFSTQIKESIKNDHKNQTLESYINDQTTIIQGEKSIETIQEKETSIFLHKSTTIYNSEKILSIIPQKETTPEIKTTNILIDDNNKSQTIITGTSIPQKTFQCEKGYFIPDDDETAKTCQKCSIENCEKCEGTKGLNNCILCSTSFFPVYENETIRSCDELCKIGNKENCKSCNTTSNQCSSCNVGYFIPEDDEAKKGCQKCTIKNCEKCYGTKSSNICSSCMNSYKAIYENEIIKSCEFMCQIGEDDKCLTCDDNKCSSCNIGYNLIDGKCKANYTIKATYHTDLDKEDVQVIYNNILKDIEGMIVNGENVYPSHSIYFPLSGNHTIYFKLKNKTYTSLDALFSGIQNLDSVVFIEELNTENLTSMVSMFFGCSSLNFHFF